MPEEIARRCIKMFSFYGGVVLDPFAGSGTTLKVAKELGREYVGYEIYETYKEIINKKLDLVIAPSIGKDKKGNDNE
jgi:M2.ncuI DNA methyltransferase